MLPAVLPTVLLWAARAGATTFPATLEVDLIFPRNDTYAPSTLFAHRLRLPERGPGPDARGLSMNLWDITDNFKSGLHPASGPGTLQLLRQRPTYVYTHIYNLPAAVYMIVWSFGARDCSVDGIQGAGDGAPDVHMSFTIQDGAQKPDLVASTASRASCSNATHFAFNLTGTMNRCAVFSDVQPVVAGNPCAVQVGSATASSISAAITSRVCSSAASAVVSCRRRPTRPRCVGYGVHGCVGRLGGCFCGPAVSIRSTPY